MLLEEAHKWLGWPTPQDILKPPGEGPKVYQEFAQRKLEAALKRESPQLAIRTGILAANPHSADSTAPLAVVCEFQNGANDRVLAEAHRLAWSFSRTALLVTLEPHRLIAWSCHIDPKQSTEQRQLCALPTPDGLSPTGSLEQRRVRDLLHWVSLITGHFQRKVPEKFPADGRADELLLKNLKHVRRELLSMGLSRDYCHDLLARVIFTQFLFHRRDSEGNAFFSPRLLERLRGDVLRHKHDDLGSILGDKDETYSLFRWLDAHFNGDLFPGKDDATDEERDSAWQKERDAVRTEHLGLLADLVSGTISTTDGQLLLWPFYSFDVIPLEFISSIYEEFLNEDKYTNKAFYTPAHLVDYVLDAVLPWHGHDWNLRILDPCCGSGIFLVKAFQRLIYRWRRANGREPLVRDLKPILAENLVGVDINPKAVRVASFSLYLAMADAIEPKHYVTREQVFPRLRGKRLIANDFFDETTPGFRTREDAHSYRLVIGNAPWGDKSIKKTSDRSAVVVDSLKGRRTENPQTKAEGWARAHDWPIANNDVGPLFVAKSLELVGQDGRVAMVQPAQVWLYHRSNPALDLRRRLFESFTVDEITNLVAVRREVFADVIGPACILVVGTARPTHETSLFYFAPKPLKNGTPLNAITIEPHDVSQVRHVEAANDSALWAVLALGGPRDLQLIGRLSQFQSLAKLEAKSEVLSRLGVIPGKGTKALPQFRGKRYLDAPTFPSGVFLHLDAKQLPQWSDPRVSGKDSTDFSAFQLPQLLIKHSYSTKEGRFRAVLVRSDDPTWGVICKKTYLTVRDCAQDAKHIQPACLVYNSLLAVYFLALTSYRFPLYNNEVTSEVLMTVPLPPSSEALDDASSFEEIDHAIRESFALTPADWTIIEDQLDFTLPDCLRKAPGPGRKPTRCSKSEPELSVYAQTMFRVLKSTFGKDKEVSATVYQEPDEHHLPVRMVTLHFDWPEREALTIESIAADGLLDLLNDFARKTLKINTGGNIDSVGFQRVAYLFHSDQTEHGRVRSLTIVKPDERRYWTRSLAMRDADDLAAAIFKAAGWKGGS